jgi:hypothetical protein
MPLRNPHASSFGGCCDEHGPAPAPSAAASAAAAAAAAASSSGLDSSEPALLDRAPSASLRLEFSRAEQLYQHIEGEDSSSAGGPAYACLDHSVDAHVRDALRAFLSCAVLVRREGVAASRGETLEDINTEDIRYLLVEFYIASLRGKATERRRENLALARLGFEAFIETAARVGAIPPAERRALGLPAELDGDRGETGGVRLRGTGVGVGGEGEEENVEDERAGGRGAGSSSTRAGAGTLAGGRVGGGSLIKSSELRGQKIERFRRNQAAKKRLAELAAHHKREADAIRRAMGRGEDEGALADGVGGRGSLAGGGGGGGGGPDEESLREMATLAVAIAARTAADEILAIEQELPLLAHAERMAAERTDAREKGGVRRGPGGRGEDDGRGSSASSSSEVGGPPPDDMSVRPDRPGLEVTHIDPTFTARRETIKAEVFRQGHRAPTMGLEEWGGVVMDIAGARQEREREQAQHHVATLAELREQGREDETEAYDKATARQRAYDDWADGVPKGSGVTKRV